MSQDEAPRPYHPVEPVEDARKRWFYRRLMTFGACFLLGVILVLLAVEPGAEGKFEATIWAFVTLVGVYIGAPVADDFLQTLPSARARAA